MPSIMRNGGRIPWAFAIARTAAALLAYSVPVLLFLRVRLPPFFR